MALEIKLTTRLLPGNSALSFHGGDLIESNRRFWKQPKHELISEQNCPVFHVQGPENL